MAKEVKMNITKFLGLWYDNAGNTGIPEGALAQLQNFQILSGYKLRKRSGYSSLLDTALESPIRGQWYGKLGNTYYHLFACNGHVYKNNGDGTITDLGTLTDDKTEFFQFLDTKNIKQHKATVGIEMGHSSNTHLRLGQTFTPTRDSVVTSIVVKMGRVNNPSDNIVAKLYTVEGGVPKTLISAATNYIGGSSVIETSQSAITSYTNCVFYFNSVNLSANTTYAFVIERTGPINVTNYYYVLTGGDTYPGGSLVHYNGTVWESTPSSELWFEINFKYEYSIYIMNGYEYKKFDGVTLSTVEGYVPIVMTGTLPSGAGTSYEPINSLTGKKRQRFNGDFSSSVYYLAEKSVDSINRIEINGVDRTTNFTRDIRAGTVNFGSDYPGEGIDNVEIEWTKGTGSRTDIVNKTNYTLYGGKNDSRVFLYGDGNELRYSDIANLIQSAEYFPVTNYITCGSKDSNVNNLNKQYDRLIINTETESLWASYDFDSSLGASIAVYPLNDSVGCTVKGCGQIIENNPYIIFNNQVYQIVASNVRDERNVQYMSERVQTLLNELDLSNALTLDYEKYGEYWIVIDKKAYIYNYRLDVWYYYYFADNVTSLLVVDNEVVLGTDNGQLFKMDGSLDDNGELINAFAETGWLNYGHSSLLKFLNFMWVHIFPEYDTSGEIYFQTDRGEPRLVKEIFYKNLAFDDVDFADLSFMTNYNPKSFRLKPKAKKFVYIKFTFINNKRNKLTLLGLAAPSLLGGQSK